MSSYYPEWHTIKNIWIISETFSLIVSEHCWPQVTKTVQSETSDKGGLPYVERTVFPTRHIFTYYSFPSHLCSHCFPLFPLTPFCLLTTWLTSLHFPNLFCTSLMRPFLPEFLWNVKLSLQLTHTLITIPVILCTPYLVFHRCGMDNQQILVQSAHSFGAMIKARKLWFYSQPCYR